MSELERFLNAQEKQYDIALKEIKFGSKDSCWMWYIFPQLKGLGFSEVSQYYGIKNIEEAIEYLNNEILRNRLIEISQALLDLEDVDIHKVMGSPDDLKLKSSMTLFKKAEELSDIKCDNIFQKVLNQFFGGEEDPKTLAILEKQNYDKINKNNNIILDNDIKNKILDEKKTFENEKNFVNEDEENQKDEMNDLNFDQVKVKHLESIMTVTSMDINEENNNYREEKKYNDNLRDKEYEKEIEEDEEEKCKCLKECIII